VTQKIMARILGVTERTIIDLEGGRELSEGIGRRVTELDRLQHELGKVVRSKAIGHWLTNRTMPLMAMLPLISSPRAKSIFLWRMIFELRSGVSS